jgi:hypothetical protein
MLRALEPTPGRAKPPPAKQGTEQTNKNKTPTSKANLLFISHLVLLSFCTAESTIPSPLKGKMPKIPQRFPKIKTFDILCQRFFYKIRNSYLSALQARFKGPAGESHPARRATGLRSSGAPASISRAAKKNLDAEMKRLYWVKPGETW